MEGEEDERSWEGGGVMNGVHWHGPFLLVFFSLHRCFSALTLVVIIAVMFMMATKNRMRQWMGVGVRGGRKERWTKGAAGVRGNGRTIRW